MQEATAPSLAFSIIFDNYPEAVRIPSIDRVALKPPGPRSGLLSIDRVALKPPGRLTVSYQ
jgi:hypothetical protein